MRKIRAAVEESDRIVISIIDFTKIQYSLVEARTGRKHDLGEPVKFSLSVKNFFGVNGKTIRELYSFSRWYNPKLKKEMDRIWRLLDKQFKQKEVLPLQRASFDKKHVIADGERAA